MPYEIAQALVSIIDSISTLMTFLILAAVIVSLLNADPRNPLVQIIHQLTEPMLQPIRKYSLRIPGPLDWSPLILLALVKIIAATLKWLIRISTIT